MSEDRYPAERVASILGKTSAEVAAFDRVFTGLREVAISSQMLYVEMGEMAGAFRNFADAWRYSEERLCAAEADEIAAHPDLAEVNVYLDGYFA